MAQVFGRMFTYQWVLIMIEVLMFLPGNESFIWPLGPWAIPQSKSAKKNVFLFKFSNFLTPLFEPCSWWEQFLKQNTHLLSPKWLD